MALTKAALPVGAWLLAAAVQLAPLAAHAQGSAPFSSAALTLPPKDGWPTNGGNLYNQRYSPLTSIHRGNVAQLKGVWRTHLRGSGLGPQYSGEAQPIVYRGVIYISTGANDVFAVSVDTGAILWEYRANLDPKNTAVCCGWTNRGVALGRGGRAGQDDGIGGTALGSQREGGLAAARPTGAMPRLPPRP